MKKIHLFYFVFCLAYCFVLVDGFHLNLSDDNVTVAAVCMRDARPEIFTGDPLKLDIKEYYLPVFTKAVTLLWRLAGEYITTLRVFLFAVMFPTLCFSHVLLRGLFKESGEVKIAAGTLFLNMILFCLPSGEMFGFGGLHSAIARYLCGAFLPLLLLFYYRDAGLRAGGLHLSTISILGLASGLLVNLHPPSAVSFYAILGAHWLLVRSEFLKGARQFKAAIGSALASGLFFAAGSLFYTLTYISLTFTLGGGAAAPSAADTLVAAPAPAAAGKLAFFFLRPIEYTGLLYFLEEALYPPFLLSFLFFALCFDRRAAEKLPGGRALCFIRQIALVGYPICVAGLFLRCAVNLGPFFYPFQRADRILIYVVALSVLWLFFFGRGLFKSRWAFAGFGLALAFFWAGAALTKGRFQYDFLKCGVRLQEQGLLYSGAAAAVALLLMVLWRARGGVFRRLALLFLAAFFVVTPFLGGGIVMLASHTLNSLNGLGAWKIAAAATGSRAYARMESFEDSAGWVRKNTPREAMFFYFDPHRALHMKIAAMRRGMGCEYEIGTTPEEYYLLDDLYNDFESGGKKWPDLAMALMEQRGLEYAMIENGSWPDERRELEKIYSNEFYTIYKKEKKR